jgi:hypothetical protein
MGSMAGLYRCRKFARTGIRSSEWALRSKSLYGFRCALSTVKFGDPCYRQVTLFLYRKLGHHLPFSYTERASTHAHTHPRPDKQSDQLSQRSSDLTLCAPKHAAALLSAKSYFLLALRRDQLYHTCFHLAIRSLMSVPNPRIHHRVLTGLLLIAFEEYQLIIFLNNIPRKRHDTHGHFENFLKAEDCLGLR